MTLEHAIKVLEALRMTTYADEAPSINEALRMAITRLRSDKAHWDIQKRIADAGGHGPCSDF